MTLTKNHNSLRTIAKPKPKPIAWPLKQRYESMNNGQKQTFFGNIITLTGKSRKTIYRWISGQRPSLADQKIIAFELGLEVKTLFKAH